MSNTAGRVIRRKGFGATVNVAKPTKGSTVAVFGLGAVGLVLIAEMTNGGVDRSIECTGSTEAMISAFECVHDSRAFPSSHTNNCTQKVLNTTKALKSQFIFRAQGKMTNKAGQVIRCKAAVAWEAGKPLEIEDVEVAPPQKFEVRVKIHYTSLCHTDVYFWEAKGQNLIFPRILGHEAGGIVESVGEGVTDLAPGDHVLPVFTGECKKCAHCKSKESNLCDLLRINTDRGVMIHDQKSRFSIKGEPIFHFVGTSTFSQYTVVHVGCLAKINPDAPLDKVCVLGCEISTGFGAIVNVAKPKKGSTVAVFGLGAVGLAKEPECVVLQGLLVWIQILSDVNKVAKKFGVTEFVNPEGHNKPVHEVISDMTEGGVDISVECTGSTDAMISAFECVHDGWGVAVLVEVPHEDAVSNTYKLRSERTLKSTFFGNYKPRSDIPSVVEKYMNKELKLEKFITHQVPFSKINKAFKYMREGESIRCVIKMEE
ncbi:alcohol dehydrogenase [Camellia lanceoleosa]|uniref:Alcohol dehydrogenase n=1 Tax=Camellia lanceoleosa TaxID=1840588 RepID=A0ACC0GS03_9ERIC|nr:alcohol dehydrogenase [Camellia lanceoleosa]